MRQRGYYQSPQQKPARDICVPQAWNHRQLCLKGTQAFPRTALDCLVFAGTCHMSLQMVHGVQNGSRNRKEVSRETVPENSRYRAASDVV